MTHAGGSCRDACECKRIVSISPGLFSIIHGIEIAFAQVKGYYNSISLMQTGKSSGEAPTGARIRPWGRVAAVMVPGAYTSVGILRNGSGGIRYGKRKA